MANAFSLVYSQEVPKYTYELDDVVRVAPLSDNDIFAWDATSARWINQTAADAGVLTSTTGLLKANNLSDVANAATSRTNLGLAIGTNVQAYDAQLADVAGLTPTDNGVIIGNGANFVVESGATLKTSLGLTIGTDIQAYDADLTTWAGKTAPSGTVVGTSDTQTLTNKTLEHLIYDVVSKTADYTAANESVIFVAPSGIGDVTITIPDPATVVGKSYYIKRQTTGGGNVVVVGAAGNIDGAATKTLATNYAGILVCSDGTNWFILSQMGTVT